ncbi:hypothetical protein VA596_43485 [Amycolatopsis sp., V23-08]|uniref:Uncharacterized protein n=1 Tax=Amycolatopsis heterodermiae TaxID=3110235 RepID=A0ABU5RJJ0_9PSEU|nr:hypothetical protein [Amycolatopsis sp., V23-08]MEA5366457.1 hypothetical protein [Amycolatopsis sp., V23-08]
MNQQEKARRRRVIIVVIALLIIGMVGYGTLVDTWVSAVVRALLLIIMVLLLFLVLKPMDQKACTMRPTPFGEVHQVGDDQIEEAQKNAGTLQLVDLRQAKLFALAITAPSDVRKRVVDSYSLGERSVRQTATIEAFVRKQFNGGSNGSNSSFAPVLFPILTPPKGRLLDNLEVVGSDGEALPVLTYRESVYVAISVLRLLLTSACKGQIDVDAAGMTPAALKAERNAVKLIITRNTQSKKISAEDIRKVRVEIQALSDPPQQAQGSVKAATLARKLAAGFVEKVAAHYVIIASVKPGDDGRFVIRASQTLIPDLQLQPTKFKWLHKSVGSITVALGSRPVDITIDIENASTCQSYHLRVEGVDGMYVAEQEAIEISETLDKWADGAPTKPHPRFQKRLGQAEGHFYVRYFPQPAQNERPRIRFRYSETPPGSLLRGAVTSAACLFLVWLIGAITNFNTDPGTDAPAVLLAFPAVAATWLGFDRRGGRLVEGTFEARRGLLYSALISIGAAGLFMAHKQIDNFGTPLPWSANLLGVQDLYWAMLLLFAIANFINLGYKCMVDTWEYCELAGRPQVGNPIARRG